VAGVWGDHLLMRFRYGCRQGTWHLYGSTEPGVCGFGCTLLVGTHEVELRLSVLWLTVSLRAAATGVAMDGQVYVQRPPWWGLCVNLRRLSTSLGISLAREFGLAVRCIHGDGGTYVELTLACLEVFINCYRQGDA